jgi:hypothetical protein
LRENAAYHVIDNLAGGALSVGGSGLTVALLSDIVVYF